MKLLLILSLFITSSIYAEDFPTEDLREPVVLTKVEKNLALGEMRLFLESLNGVFKALSNNDYVKAAFHAKKSGMVVPTTIRESNPDIINKLPLKMKLTGMMVHKMFDSLASDLENQIPLDQVMNKLGKITNKCVWCHQTYRFEEEN